MAQQRETFSYFVSVSRPFMIDQLQKEVPDYLLERNVLTRQEYDEITSYDSREDQITYLLDVLPSKTEDQFQLFYAYIQSWYPWILGQIKLNKTMQEDREKLKSALDEGEVPPLPFTHALRKQEYLKLLKILQELKRNEYVVVHGMRGCGKSTLVSSTLYQSESLVLDTFGKKVFWVSIGPNADEFTVQLDLCGRLGSFYALQPLPSDSIGAIRYLKDRFQREEMENCLLILDDVSRASFVSALDVGCKILITTDDISVMNEVKKPVKRVKVSDGFTESETLKLFSASIECEQLPPYAKNIHAMCKGFPLTISLISSQLAEHKQDVRQNTDRWREYESKLKEEGIEAAIGPYDRSRSEQVTLLYRAIGMSIDSLNPEMRRMYLNFALFMEDVNIRPEVLSILWNKSRKQVIDIMVEFEKKNLVIRDWNSSKNTYIYCVHDLLLDYLKKLLTTIEKRNLHQEIIACYRREYGDDFMNFPVDDNYILLYLGYHLKEAGMTVEFPALYLNLIFVEKKIMHYGAADLLSDFKKYKPQITHGDMYSKEYEDFLHFIKRDAANRSLSNCDLISFALLESKDSAVYKAALALKQSREASSYFELLTQAPMEDSPPTPYHDRDKIGTAAFTCTGDVLIANMTGLIRRINIVDNNFIPTKTFEGHTARVSQIQMKNTKNLSFFLSASDDATVRVWNANGNGNHEIENRRTPSPQLKQNDWKDLWPNQRPKGEQAMAILEHDVPIKWAQFSNNPGNMNIVTVDVRGGVSVRFTTIEKEGNEIVLRSQQSVDIDTKKDITTCSFTNDDSLVVCADRGGLIYIYKAVNGDLVSRLQLTNCDVKSMIVIPDLLSDYLECRAWGYEISQITAVILGESDFYVIDIEPVETDQICELQPQARFVSTDGHKRTDNYMCAAVSWDGKFVAIATTNYNLHVYDIRSGHEVLKFSESNGRISNVCWSLQNDMLLTSYFDSDILKIWTVRKDGVLNNSVKLRKTAFDAAWLSEDDEDEGLCITAVLDNRNHINIFFDLRLENELNLSPDKKITQVCVCPQGGYIVYALENGDVFIIDPHTWKERKILTVSHHKTLRMKTFGSRSENEDRELVLVVSETETGENSLMGWKRTTINASNPESIETEIVVKSLPQQLIRDYVADLKSDRLFVVTDDHVFSIYDLFSGDLMRVEDLKTYKLDKCLTAMKYSDISTNFTCIVTGNGKQRFIRPIRGNAGFIVETEGVMRMCKLSPDAQYLIVVFEDNYMQIYNTLERRLVDDIGPYKFHPGSVLDISWSPSSDRFIVIFDREISLYKINQDVNLLANLYISVDKLVSNKAFTKSATVDSGGHFRVLQYPF